MFVQKERKKNSGTGKWLTSVRRCTGAVHEHHFCNANNIPNNGYRLSMFVLQFIYVKRGKKNLCSHSKTHDRTVCVRAVYALLIFHFLFAFSLSTWNSFFMCLFR